MPTAALDPNLRALQNLFFTCAGATPGAHALILHEPASEGYYEPGLEDVVADGARRLGLSPEIAEVPFDPDARGPDPVLAARIACADLVVWLARMGDQARFRPGARREREVVCYALNAEMLRSDFGGADHRAFRALNGLIASALAGAREIRLTCPLGTDVRGGRALFPPGGGDVCVQRFPLSVFAPVPADNFSGRVAQAGFLVGAGATYYQPYACELSEPIFVNFEGGVITGFDGAAEDVSAARAHYAGVGVRFGSDPWTVHSWHAGIHPACAHSEAASKGLERWSGSAFGNPRILHFHTCGAVPPGEISLNVIDPTVEIDGVAVWEEGHLRPERLAGAEAALAPFPDVLRLFEAPRRDVGLAPGGRLSYR